MSALNVPPKAVSLARTEIDSFSDNRDGTSTLQITCANGRQIFFTLPTRKIKDMRTDDIYSLIIKECSTSKE